MSKHKDYYTYRDKEKLKLAVKPFAGGGEGDLYAIASPRKYSHLVAKIYHPFKRSPERANKIKYLIRYAPRVQDPNVVIDNHDSLIWPVELIYQGREFVGVLMPLVKGEKLEVLTLLKLPRTLGKDWRYLGRNRSHAMALRLRICFNLALAIHQLHMAERYILVDLKPDNVMIQSNGQLSLVDMDSIEVVENSKTLYSAPVATPEYTPPEFYRRTSSYHPNQYPTWDLFSLGVILYKILLGVHPFAASAKPPFDRFTDLSNKIKHGLFVHSSNRKALFSTVPPPHEVFHQLDKHIQHLFIRCFEYGHQEPEERPTAEEWCTVLAEHLNLELDLQFLSSRFAHIRDDIRELLPKGFNKEQLEQTLKGTLNPPRKFIKIPKVNIDQALIARLHDAFPEPKIQTLEINSMIFFGVFGLIILYVSPLLGCLCFSILVMVGVRFLKHYQPEKSKEERYEILEEMTGLRPSEKSLERKIKRLRRQIGQKNSKQRKSYKRYTKLYDEYIILQSSISAKIRAFKRKYNQFVHRDLEDMQQFLKTENKKLEGLQEQQKSAMLNVRDEYLEKLRKHPVFEKVKIDNYSLLMEFLDRIPVKLENIHDQYRRQKTLLNNNYRKQTAFFEKELRISLADAYQQRKKALEEKMDDESWVLQQQLITLNSRHDYGLDKDEMQKLQEKYVKEQFFNYPEYRKINDQIDDCKQELEDINILKKGGYKLSSFELRSARFLREEIEELEEELDRLEYELEYEILNDIRHNAEKRENQKGQDYNPKLVKQISIKLKQLKQQRRKSLQALKANYNSNLSDRLDKLFEENKNCRQLKQEYTLNIESLERKYTTAVESIEDTAKAHIQAKKDLKEEHDKYLVKRSEVVDKYRKLHETYLENIDKRVYKEKRIAKEITHEFNQEILGAIKKIRGVERQYKKAEYAFWDLDQEIEKALIELRPMETLVQWLDDNEEDDD